MPASSIQPVSSPTLTGVRVAFCGKLAGMNRREAQQLVRQHGGVAVDRLDDSVHVLVLGEDGWPLGDAAEALGAVDDATRSAVERGELEVVTESQFWQRLGLIDAEQHIQRLYTPAMLAELLNVPVSVIRRWHRRGLIKPIREVRRLAYFDFQEVSAARRLAELLAAGVSPQAIERQLQALRRFLPGAERSLAQLSIIVEGKRLLLRQGDGLLDPRGQWRFDFDAGAAPSQAATVSLPDQPVDEESETAAADAPEDILELAARMEDEGQLAAAAATYRTALAAGGPRADVCFILAELLYRLGDVSAARERYYMAIEIDEDYVEARANLGCILAETGQAELAVAAFQGALAFHPDYADAHYHLARTLDDVGRADQATRHWQAFLQLAPDSPWATTARQRLNDE